MESCVVVVFRTNKWR